MKSTVLHPFGNQTYQTNKQFNMLTITMIFTVLQLFEKGKFLEIVLQDISLDLSDDNLLGGGT